MGKKSRLKRERKEKILIPEWMVKQDTDFLAKLMLKELKREDKLDKR